MHFLISIGCMVGGIAFLVSAFYLQKLEDRERMPGFYTTATITSIKPGQDKTQTAVTFELTKDFKVQQITDVFPAEEAANWAVGRRSLVVYDEEKQKIYYNPMRKWRKAQAAVMLWGFMLLFFGISWLYAGKNL